MTRTDRAVGALATALGIAVFLPIGASYLLLFLLTCFLLSDRASCRERWPFTTHPGIGWLLLASLVWPVVVVLAIGWEPASASRLFHVVRVAWVMTLGLMLRPNEAWKAIYGMLIGAGLSVTLILVHQVWPLPENPLWIKLLIVDGNASSQKMIMLACTAGVSLWLALEKQRNLLRRLVLLLLAVAGMTAAARYGYSRNAYLLLVLLPGALFLYRLRHHRAALWVPPVLVLTIFALAWSLSPVMQARWLRAISELQASLAGLDYEGSSVGVRWAMFRLALDSIWTHPLLGTGLGSWEPIWYARSAVEAPLMSMTNNPHNDFLLYGMETGLPGMLILVATLGWFLWKSWVNQSPLGGIAFLLAIAVVVTAMINAPFRDATLGMSLIWLMAATTNIRNRSPQTHPDQHVVMTPKPHIP